MILSYSDIQRYENMPWQDYVKLPGYSFSYLKREVQGVSPAFTPSNKVLRGSLVDAILMQQDDVDMRSALFPEAKIIASALIAEFGEIICCFTSQDSYTGTLSYAGLRMPVKGRLDWRLQVAGKTKAVIDLKITEATNIKELIKFMKYDAQQNNYMGLSQGTRAYILPYNPKLKKVLSIEPLEYDENNSFWIEKVLKFGKV